jgi:hypothetical protein
MKHVLTNLLSWVTQNFYALIAVGAIFTLLAIFPPLRDRTWSAAVIGFFVVAILVAAIWFSVASRHPVGSEEVRSWRLTSEGVTAVAAALAIFVAYASFRNQSRLAAEANLNAEGHALFEIEMSDRKGLRRLYSNYAHDDPDKCLLETVRNADQWSAALFYVEEALWLLEKAEDDRIAWGSAYSADIAYWREYINDDPTGMFSYYLVANRGGSSKRSSV